MTEETVNELTERVAGMVETIAAGGQVNMTEFRMSVLEVCQMAQGGAGVRPVPCHIEFAPFIRARADLPSITGLVWPVYSAEGLALSLRSAEPPQQREWPEDLAQVNLGSEGGLLLANELQAAAALQAGLAARQRAN